MEGAVFQPMVGPLAEQKLWSPKLQRRLIGAFLLLGLLARFFRYFLCFPLWDDESFLCTNFIDRGFGELLQPLNFHQVAPLLFLWIECAITQLLGYSEFTLRLFPFIVSLASLFLFAHLARRLLTGPAVVLAIATFAVAYPCIRYAAEAKQYGSDLFVSLVLITLVVEWWRQPTQQRWLWLLTASLPLALGLSFPAVFTAGGISLFIAYQSWRASRNRHAWLAWFVFNIVLVVSFAGYYFLTIRPQSSAELGFMRDCWHLAFPPITEPGNFVVWTIYTHSSNLLAYPVGGDRGASSLTLVCVLAALFFLVRRRHYPVVLLLLAPLALHFVAAALQRYPYGVHVKYSQYIAPAICLLSGLGTAAWTSLLMRTPARARAGLYVSLSVLAIIGAGCIIRDITHPYKTKTDMRARAFARWFWFNASFDSVPVCLKSDLHIDFSPKTYEDLNWSAMYLCNQRIYSLRHQQQRPPQWQLVTRNKPLRVVQFKAPRCPYDQKGFKHWLKEINTRYELVGRDTFAFPCYAKDERRLINVDKVEVYKFLPRPGVSPQIQTARK